MKKVPGIIVAIIGVMVVLWLLSYVIEFVWELFWVIVVFSGIAYEVKKFK